jgi:hypothetical protein
MLTKTSYWIEHVFFGDFPVVFLDMLKHQKFGKKNLISQSFSLYRRASLKPSHETVQMVTIHTKSMHICVFMLKTVLQILNPYDFCFDSDTTCLLFVDDAVLFIWQLCPLYPQNPQVLLNEMRCPSELLQYGEFSDCMDFSIGSGNPLLNVVNPAFDYVSPELVSLFITDMYDHSKC